MNRHDRKVLWSIRITGWLHILALLAVGSLVPDRFAWWIYAVIGMVWLLLLLASVEMVQGRRIGIVVLTVFHWLLFPTVVLLFCYLFYETFTMNDPERRGPAIALYFVLQPGVIAMFLSALMLAWMRHVNRQHIALFKPDRLVQSSAGKND